MNSVFRTTLLMLLLMPAISHSAVQAGSLRSQEPFTLEQVLSAPFPSGLRAARAGNRVAWVFDTRGVRNVWVAEGPDLRPRALTHYGADDGQEIGDLQWSPDAAVLVYVRGGSKNQAGEFPNPTSDAAGGEQAVWSVPFSGGAPRKLGVGSAPAVSPAGDRVAFVRDAQVWVAPLSGNAPAAQFFQARGRLGSLAWSPDGTRLAFVSERGTHSFIGVYDPRSAAVRFLAPGVDRDSDPRWSPDGRRVAFFRFNTTGGGSGGMFFGADRDLRWSIWVADAATAQGRAAWEAPAREGGTFNRQASVLEWGAEDRLVFAAELDGWHRLYSLPAAGGNLIALSGSDCEVEHVALAPDRRSLVYSSNCGDVSTDKETPAGVSTDKETPAGVSTDKETPVGVSTDKDRRHLWRVAVRESPPSPLTSGKSLEWSPQVLSDGRTVAYLGSDERRPASVRATTLEGGKMRAVTEIVPAGFPSQHLVEPQQVILTAADGWKIHGQLFVPAAAQAGGTPALRHPAVVYVHGGPIRQMLLGFHYMHTYHEHYAFNQLLASRGYVVLSVNFRSGIGYGRAFRQAPQRGARGASEYQDVLAAAQYLRARPDVDPARVGIWGGSYGGYLTAMALARNSDLFAAGVDLVGVHDWSQFRRPDSAPGDAKAAQLARESSPVASIKNWRSPVLLVHGDDDRNVAFAQTVDLVARLREQKVPFEHIVYPDELHSFVHARTLETLHSAIRFFDKHLKKKTTSQPGASTP